MDSKKIVTYVLLTAFLLACAYVLYRKNIDITDSDQYKNVKVVEVIGQSDAAVTAGTGKIFRPFGEKVGSGFVLPQ